MANDTNSFMAFPGITTHRLAFPNFIKDVFDKLAFKGSRDYGLLGYVLTDEEWLALPGNQEAFVPAPNPGPAPPAVPAAPWQEWQHLKKSYDDEKAELNKATAQFMNALDEHAKMVVEGDEGTVRGKTLLQMITVLKAEYGTITKGDLLDQLRTLDEPFIRGDNILHYLLKHSQVHNIARINGQPLSEMNKISILISGLTPCGLFDPCINNFHALYPALNQQLYATLQGNIRMYAQNQIQTPTTGTHGYAAATQQKTASSTITISQREYDELVAKAASKPHPSSSGGKKYCWTHGLQHSHDGTQCKTPAHGHIATATLSDNKGGRKNRADRLAQEAQK